MIAYHILQSVWWIQDGVEFLNSGGVGDKWSHQIILANKPNKGKNIQLV